VYCAGVAAVLSEFSESVVDYVTDPRTGLPGNSQWLPSVFEVKNACIKRQQQEFAARQQPRKLAEPPKDRPVENRPGRRAVVFIPKEREDYQSFQELTKTASTDDYLYDEMREGLWVSLTMAGIGRPKKADWMAPTHDDLRKHYGVFPNKAGAANETIQTDEIPTRSEPGDEGQDQCEV
jgi:hypothetical protein